MLKRDEQDFANKVMQEIDNKKISIMFQKPVDPDRDNCPDYDEVIKNPMCLDVVKQKLAANKYNTFSAWISDVNLIWNNAQTYNSKYSALYLMAKDIQLWFWKRLESAPKNDSGKWLSKVQKVLTQIQNDIEQ
ncbi:Bromodomain containing protein [Trichomonas vaginalis G3]|uniref:Bromodomain containing protein n=1 Tax=Trichomonas vaginalis (strain ATCC PRA-98 / G3) TaxID=412133 RepID=A2EF56_TRIV3|nr:acetylation-dependent protein binding [Trichomonas vaginalis G3]EAY08666.1 Bromodomain containing protein [Trichomonas vaginalis G3]KAI5492784.1 acetylation-dependent protein binding [Trichomonas vaginalis G3]|eukprot:XP_001320889.1 Bromodomain containing protein [Trichomonas vaginalis G3]